MNRSWNPLVQSTKTFELRPKCGYFSCKESNSFALAFRQESLDHLCLNGSQQAKLSHTFIRVPGKQSASHSSLGGLKLTAEGDASDVTSHVFFHLDLASFSGKNLLWVSLLDESGNDGCEISGCGCWVVLGARFAHWAVSAMDSI